MKKAPKAKWVCGFSRAMPDGRKVTVDRFSDGGFMVTWAKMDGAALVKTVVRLTNEAMGSTVLCAIDAQQAAVKKAAPRRKTK